MHVIVRDRPDVGDDVVELSDGKLMNDDYLAGDDYIRLDFGPREIVHGQILYRALCKAVQDNTTSEQRQRIATSLAEHFKWIKAEFLRQAPADFPRPF